jgi:hypothetical protein
MRFLMLYILLMSCGAQPAKDDNSFNLDAVKAKRDSLVSNFQLADIERCDRITFAALFNAFGGSLDLSGFESPAGKWNRDSLPCYPEESKSETSLDGYLSVLHWAHSRGDLGMVSRIADYAAPKDWITGAGPEDITSIFKLTPLIFEILGTELKGNDDALPFLSGFRAHLAAMYIWLHGRIQGHIDAFELTILEALLVNEPGAYMLSALYHRFQDGRFQDTVNMMNNYSGDYGEFWGSCPTDLSYILTVAIMEGR